MGKPNELIVVHQNIQGFSSKEHEIELFLIKYKIDVLCVTEHFFEKKQIIFKIQNYYIGSAYSRMFLKHGGSIILVKNSLKSKERTDVKELSIEGIIELSCIEIEKYIIICVYRPPNSRNKQRNFTMFESKMDDALSLISKSKKTIVIAGDFNVDLLNLNSYNIRLQTLFESYNLKNIFLEPTRVINNSATCIDNIFTNEICLHHQVLNCLKSDHRGQLAVFPNCIRQTKREVTFRMTSSNKMDKFNNVLADKLTSLDSKQLRADQLYTNFFSLVNDEFKVMFPVKNLTLKTTFTFSQWATTGIYISRDRLFELYDMKSYITNLSFQNYVQKYSKIFKKVCIYAKSLHIAEKINKSDNKIKMTWKIINNETGKHKYNDKNFEIYSSQGLISDSNVVANEFETFFTNMPFQITNSLSSSPKLAECLLKNNVKKNCNEFKFRHVVPQEIVKICKTIKLKGTEDLWGISMKVVSNVIYTIAPTMACIFNKCIDEGIFPDLLKYSKIIPLFKSGDDKDPNNFRPVSILPAFSKIFEKLMLDQMSVFFEKNNIFNINQFGFTRGRSTTDASLSLIKHILEAWEDSHDAIGVFCDLSKAFDCVDHKTLLRKLKYYGIVGNALKIIESYLKGRIQKVHINGMNSEGSRLLMGVPQGSVLGPFLFLIYINDLPFIIPKHTNMVLFADDTSLIFKVKRNKQCYDDINKTLMELKNWFTVNNLVLNAKKTKCVKFSLHNVCKIQPKISIDKELLEVVDSTVFLGITIDSKLQWGNHIKNLASKLSSAAYAIRRIRRLTNMDTARLVYFAYFHSIMSYGIMVWGRAADIETIFILQKRAIRAIYNLRTRDSLKDLFKNINILTAHCQYIYEIIIYVRKNLNLFFKNSEKHSYSTRNKTKLAVPKFRLTKTKKTFLGDCIQFYNKIPLRITELPDNKFKKCVKEKLINKAYYKIRDFLNDDWDK